MRISTIQIITFVGLFLTIAIFWWRNRNRMPAGGGQIGWATRTVEALAVIIIGGIPIAAAAMHGDVLHQWPLLRLEFQEAWLTGLTILLGGLFVIGLIALLLRTSLACILLLPFALLAAAPMFDAHHGYLEHFAEPDDLKPMTYLTIGDAHHYHDAQLHINGVYMGKLPVTMTVEEFRNTVPSWTEPPDGIDVKKIGFSPGQPQIGLNGEPLERPWTIIKLPIWEETATTNGIGNTSGIVSQTYYAQIRWQGQWLAGWSGSHSANTRPRLELIHRGFSLIDDRYEESIENHLMTVKSEPAAIDEAWFVRLDSLGQDGYRELWEKAENDADYEAAWHNYGRRKHGFDQVRHVGQAWTIFEAILKSVDNQGWYDTRSADGAAMEVILPHLDTETLVEHAERIINDGHVGIGYSHSSKGERGFFASSFSYADDDALRNAYYGGSNRYPFSAYAVAHAVWKMDELLDAEDDTRPNIIETRVPAKIVYRAHIHNLEHCRELEIAELLGWPGLYEFYHRQPWWRQPKDTFDDVAVRVGDNKQVNGWLLRLLNLDDANGAAFRVANGSHMRDAAKAISEVGERPVDFNKLRFLFLDNNLGANSPAVLYWPQFKQLQSNHGFWSYMNRVKYLDRLGDLATPAMYVDAWASMPTDPTGLRVSLLDDLPDEKRLSVYEALLADAESIVANPDKQDIAWRRSPQRLESDMKRLRLQIDRLKKELDQ